MVTIRPVAGHDEGSLRAFLGDLCNEARRLRFFSGAVDTVAAAHDAAESTIGSGGLVAHDESGMIVGHALYVPLAPTRAEVAVEVADHLHGRGLGTILIERLAVIAEQQGITHFVAEVLRENSAMLDVFRGGFDARVIGQEGTQEKVEFLTSGWRLAQGRFGSARRSGTARRPSPHSR
jgi:GNAT superfamily N-acetyltransferase